MEVGQGELRECLSRVVWGAILRKPWAGLVRCGHAEGSWGGEGSCVVRACLTCLAARAARGSYSSPWSRYTPSAPATRGTAS